MFTNPDAPMITVAEVVDSDTACRWLRIPAVVEDGEIVPCPHGDHDHQVRNVSHD